MVNETNIHDAKADADADDDADNDADADTEIDNSWVETYKKSEENFNKFYPEPLNSLNIFFIHVNNDNTLDNIRQEKYPLTVKNSLFKNQLISLIKNNEVFNHRSYKLMSLFSYHIDLTAENIEEFVYSDHSKHDMYTSRFFKPLTLVNDIYFSDTISMFHDLNALYIVFKAHVYNKPTRVTQKIRRVHQHRRHTRQHKNKEA